MRFSSPINYLNFSRHVECKRNNTEMSPSLQKFCTYLVVTSMALLLAACSEEPVPESLPKKVKAVKLGDISNLAERSFLGRARAAQQSNLSFRVSGPLVELPIDVADEVVKGDLLACIDPTDYESRVATVRGELKSAIAANELAEAEFKRAADIKKKNPDLISDSEYDKRLGRHEPGSHDDQERYLATG
jgi:multidrug efflux pump subunit AcrA (membrane-fusion protein)